jgi:hypothetical protein
MPNHLHFDDSLDQYSIYDSNLFYEDLHPIPTDH